jgi:hypothetical protein
MKKLSVGQVCQNDNRQCKNGNRAYFSPGLFVCGCTGDGDHAPGEHCDVDVALSDYWVIDKSYSYSGSNVCRVRLPGGANCHRPGECWRIPANGNASAACTHSEYKCAPYDCNFSSCKIPCFPDFWNACGSYSCFCSTCHKSTCTKDKCSVLSPRAGHLSPTRGAHDSPLRGRRGRYAPPSWWAPITTRTLDNAAPERASYSLWVP